MQYCRPTSASPVTSVPPVPSPMTAVTSPMAKPAPPTSIYPGAPPNFSAAAAAMGSSSSLDLQKLAANLAAAANSNTGTLNNITNPALRNMSSDTHSNASSGVTSEAAAQQANQQPNLSTPNPFETMAAGLGVLPSSTVITSGAGLLSSRAPVTDPPKGLERMMEQTKPEMMT